MISRIEKNSATLLILFHFILMLLLLAALSYGRTLLGGVGEDEMKFLLNAKCDEIISIRGYITKRFEKGKSYCIEQPRVFMTSSKPFTVKERHLQQIHWKPASTYKNPLFIQSEFARIQCDDCEIRFYNQETSELNFVLLNKNEAEFSFNLPSDVIMFSILHSEPISIEVKAGEKSIEASGTGYLIYEDYDRNISVKISPDASETPAEGNQIAFPEVLGRVPPNAYVLTEKDLKKEFENPGTVSQENSELGLGEQDPNTPELIYNYPILNAMNERFKFDCIDLINVEIEDHFTIPKGKSFCSNGPFVMVSKQKVNVMAFNVTGKDLYEDLDMKPDKIIYAKNPFYVGDVYGKVTCQDDVDCKLQVNTRIELIEERYTVIALSKSEATIELLTDSKHETACFVYDNSKAVNIDIDGQHYTVSNFETCVKPGNSGKATVKISPIKTSSADEEWLFPETIGRIPNGGYAFSQKDLEKEYENPDQITQEKSTVELNNDPQETPKPEDPQETKGLHPGAIAGIGIGVIVVIVVICVIVYFVVFKNKSDHSSSSSSTS